MTNLNKELLAVLPPLLQKYNHAIKITVSLIEDNDSHFHDQVYHHLLKTTFALANLIDRIETDYFQMEVGSHTKKDLFLLSSFFHDIGKLTTQQRLDGVTRSPGHEDASADYVRRSLDKKEFAEDELVYIETLIRKHSTTNKILNLPENETSQAFFNLQKNHSTIYLELLMFGMVDNLGGDLGILDPLRFSRRISIIRKRIQDFLL